MNSLLLLATFCLCQEAASTPQPEAELRMMDFRIQMIGFKGDFDLPESVDDAAAFLKDAMTVQARSWSRDFRMSTVVGRDLSMTIGENSPLVTGVTMSPAGRVPNLTRHQTGTTVRVNSSIDSKQRLLLKLAIESSRIDRGDNDVKELEQEMLRTAIQSLIFESDIVVASGKTKAISFSQSSSDSNGRTAKALFLITATVLPD